MKRKIAAAFALLTLGTSMAVPALAHDRYYNGHYYSNRSNYGRNWDDRGYRRYSQQQYVKKALIGGGAGAVIGGLMGTDGYRADSAVKGALIGAGAGLGYEYLRRKGAF